jgi:mannose-6-phosphate isomerase-like protein (cupin superfamily)
MKLKTSLKDIPGESDPCGITRTLYSSSNITLAHVEIIGDAKAHMHKKMEEIYYVTKGEGQLVIGDTVLDIKEGDVIPIPLNTYHQLKKVANKPFEIIFITYPKFTLSDVYFPNQKPE